MMNKCEKTAKNIKKLNYKINEYEAFIRELSYLLRKELGNPTIHKQDIFDRIENVQALLEEIDENEDL